jgi:antitoxin component of MazEF toxin-antitoxin module
MVNLRIERRGDSLAIYLSEEQLQQYGLKVGDIVQVVKENDPPLAQDTEHTAAMKAFYEIDAQYENVFRELAK